MKIVQTASENWQRMLSDIIVYDPDGWNRTNFQFSWFEEQITKEEYLRKRMFSTCVFNTDKIKSKLNQN